MSLFETVLESDMYDTGGNLFFSEDDIYINFDKFKSKKANVLLVTGFSGSGKTTIAKALALAYKAEFVELDSFNCFMNQNGPDQDKIIFLKNNQPAIYEYFTKVSSFYKFNTEIYKLKKYGIRKMLIYLDDEVEKFINWAIYKSNRRMVIEGIHIPDYISKNRKVVNEPIIFKGTSKYISLFRRIKRDWELNDLLTTNLFNRLINTKHWYDTMEAQLDFARLIVMFSNDMNK